MNQEEKSFLIFSGLEMWTLMFFDVNNVDIIRYLFKDDVAYLISMSDLRVIDEAKLILKLENSGISDFIK